MAGKLSTKKIAMLMCEGFEEVEMTEPRKALQAEGATVHLISPNKDKIKAWDHDHWSNIYDVDVKLENADPTDYDAIVLPGGVLNPDKLRTIKPAIQFVNHFLKKSKPVAAICHGPWILIETKQLVGKKMTSYHSIKSDVINAGANWQNKAVVIDRMLVTSRQPSDIPVFNKAIIKIFSQNGKK